MHMPLNRFCQLAMQCQVPNNDRKYRTTPKVFLDCSFINWLWPINRPKQVYASEQFTLSACYAMSSALKMTGISGRETKSVITVCLSPGFCQSIGQIMAQVTVLVKNREMPTHQMLANAIGP